MEMNLMRNFIKKHNEKTTHEKVLIKKLNQDDILRILINHFQQDEYGESMGYGEIIGEVDKDLRFIGIFKNNDDSYPFEDDINRIDKEMDFNGDDYPCA